MFNGTVMQDFGPYRIRGQLPESSAYNALKDLGMQLAPHADKQGFDLTVPRARYFVAEAPEIPGLSGQMLDIRRQNNSENVARLYNSDTIAFDESGALTTNWAVSIDQGCVPQPSTPRPRSGHLKLVPKPGEKF